MKSRVFYITIIIILILIISNVSTYEYALERNDSHKNMLDQKIEYDYDDFWNDTEVNRFENYTEENSEYVRTINLLRSTFVSQFTVYLSWEDGGDISTHTKNQPDEFQVFIRTPYGVLYSSDIEANNEDHWHQGSIKLRITYEGEPCGWSSRYDENFENIWEITIKCVNSGDHETSTGVVVLADNGNDWKATYAYEYYDGRPFYRE